MTDELKTETTEVEKEVDAEEIEASDITKSQEETQEQIDYRAIAEEERLKRKKAEEALAAKRFRSKRQESQEWEEEPVDEDDKPLTASQLQEILARERQATQKVVESQRIRDIAKSISSSEDEAQAIIATHSNRVFPDGMSLENQLEETYAIVNRKRILGENNELKRALKNKPNVNRDASVETHDALPSSAGEPKLSGNRKDILSRQGFTWNASAKRYEKELPGGKNVLVHDHKSGKNLMQPK